MDTRKTLELKTLDLSASWHHLLTSVTAVNFSKRSCNKSFPVPMFSLSPLPLLTYQHLNHWAQRLQAPALPEILESQGYRQFT